MNVVILVGNIGAAPELKFFENGGQIAILNLATNKVHYDQEKQKQTITNWHRVVIKGAAAATAEKYLDKGSRISLQGELVTRSWEQDGRTQYITEVQAYRFNFEGGNKPQSEKKPAEEPKTTYPGPPAQKSEPKDEVLGGKEDDDLPY